MSGRQAKRLRQEFRRIHGRDPKPAIWSEDAPMVPDPRRPGRFVRAKGRIVMVEDELRQFALERGA